MAAPKVHGRALSTAGRSSRLVVSLSPADRVDALAAQRGVSRAELVRMLVREAFAQT